MGRVWLQFLGVGGGWWLTALVCLGPHASQNTKMVQDSKIVSWFREGSKKCSQKVS